MGTTEGKLKAVGKYRPTRLRLAADPMLSRRPRRRR